METTYKEWKTSFKSFYKQIALMILLIVLACLSCFVGPLAAWEKWIFIAAVVIDVLIFICIAVQRATMSLILRDNPEKPEDREVAFIVSHPLKPFSSKFRESIEVGLDKVEHIRVEQSMMQTVLNIGDIIIASSGSGDEEIHASNIPNPQAVRDEIQVHARKYSHPKEA